MAKGVLIAAGYGTRFLPVTRTIPKEMLPIVDRPALDLVVQELIDGGVDDLLVVTSRRKRALDDWFDRDAELEAVFREQGRLDQLGRIAPPRVKVTFVRQARMGGTGDAILLARAFAGRDPVVVAFPDDLVGPPNATAALLATHAATGAAVLGVADLTGQDVSAYGVVDGVDEGGGIFRVRDVVEKPAPGTEPSHLASLGRFVYTPELLDALAASAAAHRTGELYPMAAMKAVASRGGLVARVLTGTRWDTGTPLGYLQAVVDHGLADPRIGAAFDAWLRGRVG